MWVTVRMRTAARPFRTAGQLDFPEEESQVVSGKSGEKRRVRACCWQEVGLNGETKGVVTLCLTEAAN